MKEYTIDEVNEHNTNDSCWIIINNHVYDITDFLDTHPGGRTILLTIAGQDATNFFEELHRPEILEEYGLEYLIGTITE